MSVISVDDFTGLEDYIQAWDDLAANALEPNPFYEPWTLLPALKGIAKGKDIRVVLVITLVHDKPVVCGVFPLERKPRYKGLPVAAFSMWQHIYCPLCTPLIRESYARECLDAFLDWLNENNSCSLMDFNLVSGDGPFNRLLNESLTERRVAVEIGESYERAVLRSRDSADQYMCAALRRDHRKDIKRKGRRLAEMGSLEFDSLESGGDIDGWIAEFMQLEASGWKRRGGGAFACSESNRDYFVSVAKAAFARDRLVLLAMRLDGKPLAMKCNFLDAPGSFAFKIAFDESYAAYSPGVLLECENIVRFHAGQQVEWMDSCAIPDHPMIDRLWLDRRTIHSVLIPTAKTGSLLMAALPVMRSINRKLRAIKARNRRDRT